MNNLSDSLCLYCKFLGEILFVSYTLFNNSNYFIQVFVSFVHIHKKTYLAW